MVFDYKKEYKDLYFPKKKPELITITEMNYLAVSGSGDPNKEDGTYKNALEMLYSVAYTIKMSKKGEHKILGYFDFVVPPLEGLWWMRDDSKIDYSHKENFSWISMIRLPDFVTPKELDWAVKTASEKKKKDFSKVNFLNITKDYVSSKCILVVMMTNRRQLKICINLLSQKIIKLI